MSRAMHSKHARTSRARFRRVGTLTVLGVVSFSVALGAVVLLLFVVGNPRRLPQGGTTGSAPGGPTVGAPENSMSQAGTVAVPGPGWTLLATASGAIATYTRPGPSANGTIPATWNGAPSVMPVIAQRPGWLDVRLVTRPNGSTAWVRRSDVSISATPFHIEIDLATKHLELLRLGQTVVDAPAGIGTADDPTPTGQYFVAMLAAPPSAGYGPFVLVTSAHSNVISDWDGTGDALIGIHGPLGDNSEIGTTGAAISHGCIRLHLDDLAELRQVPPGTPITIASS